MSQLQCSVELEWLSVTGEVRKKKVLKSTSASVSQVGGLFIEIELPGKKTKPVRIPVSGKASVFRKFVKQGT
ncbi:hypothetical protein SARC_06647 [Sphaeroforma arctica JP610]|uniref:Uncharacterized protein n=1 Tax=Sphaeroforma arctica JP610 TaxID=667725 RepID=A0A0L0FWS4_9EUKA|nr:hypothetical protein SARC_06647 [Sphaeroforma arctica JP610]KNC81016.1 hypothetical protein SARC_06647 [Sphaeroforma arctica JP610]|eukprot:XP_014154918.1 hypothetical protein SARC_06647 [Sphaeroforma arctica JP610]